METSAKLDAPPRRRPPALRCPPLPPFDSGNLEAVRAAFAASEPCALGQAWRAEPEAGFGRGTVRAGWRGDSLMLLAELADRDIFTRATAHNQRLWELGDTFEFFLRPDGLESYVEFHVTPNNLRLQIRLPDTGSVAELRREGMEKFLVHGEAFQSRTWVDAPANLWSVFAEVKAANAGDPSASLAERRWFFSFSRYDASGDGGEPVISSTSPHAVADFHRQQEWGSLLFTLF